MQRSARLLPIGLVVAVGLVLGAPRSLGAAPSHPRTADVPAIHALLALHRPAFARTGPSADAPPIRLVAPRTPLTQSRTVLPVIREAAGPAGALWFRVMLPMRPNGSSGWVRARAGSLMSADWEIVIHRAQRRALVLDDGQVRASFQVVVGKPSTPTPLGTFFVVEKLRLAPGVTEGPWTLATSAHSTVLREYEGGTGQVALHGTTGMSAPLGTFASHGCVRFAPTAISWIAGHVDAGTPVRIVR
jgi:hypothetical protein